MELQLWIGKNLHGALKEESNHESKLMSHETQIHIAPFFRFV